MSSMLRFAFLFATLALPQAASTDSLPVITGAELTKYAKCDQPVLPEGIAPKGTEFQISAIIDEHPRIESMQLLGGSRELAFLQKPAWNSVLHCRWQPLIVDGKTVKYKALFTFTAP